MRPGVVLAVMSLAAAAAAEPPPLSPLTVPGGPPPHLMRSFPAQGATVSAGELVLVLAYDQAMDEPATDAALLGGPAPPRCLQRPRRLSDGRSFALLCQVEAGKAYALTLGPGLSSAAGRGAPASVLKFQAGDQVVDNLHDALDEAGLTDADDPVMSWSGEPASPRPAPAPPPSAAPTP